MFYSWSPVSLLFAPEPFWLSYQHWRWEANVVLTELSRKSVEVNEIYYFDYFEFNYSLENLIYYYLQIASSWGYSRLFDILEAAFLMKNLTHGWIKSERFFQNQGIFFNFKKTVVKTSFLPPVSCALVYNRNNA